MTYHNPTKEFFAASSVTTEISERIKQLIIGDLGRLLVKMVTAVSRSCFENKQAFLKQILKEFAEQHSFGEFKEFIETRERFFEKRMHKYMDEIVLREIEQSNGQRTSLEVVVEQETEKYLSTLVIFFSKLIESAPFSNLDEFSEKYSALLTQFSTDNEMEQRNMEGIPERSVLTGNMQDITNYTEFITLACDLIYPLKIGIVDSVRKCYNNRFKHTTLLPVFNSECDNVRVGNVASYIFKSYITGVARIIIGFKNRNFESPHVESFVFPNNTDPIALLSGQVFGCTHNCPFCSAPCSYSEDGHAGKHEAREHYPLGVVGLRLDDSSELCTYNCEVAVASDTKFNVRWLNRIRDDKSWNWFRKFIFYDGDFIEFSSYQACFPNWDITPDRESEPSDYWKWFMSTYKDDLLMYYSRAKNLNIPVAWTAVTWAAAKQSLENNVD